MMSRGETPPEFPVTVQNSRARVSVQSKDLIGACRTGVVCAHYNEILCQYIARAAEEFCLDPALATKGTLLGLTTQSREPVSVFAA